MLSECFRSLVQATSVEATTINTLMPPEYSAAIGFTNIGQYRRYKIQEHLAHDAHAHPTRYHQPNQHHRRCKRQSMRGQARCCCCCCCGVIRRRWHLTLVNIRCIEAAAARCAKSPGGYLPHCYPLREGDVEHPVDCYSSLNFCRGHVWSDRGGTVRAERSCGAFG